ncbi:MAG TPA: cryptochrome/photolyase family protein [Trebonia sp.]
MNRRWLFADQLGPHFLDDPGQPVLLVESRAAFARRPVHRRRAHLLLSALRHRAAELGDQALLVQSQTYEQGRAEAGGELTVCAPTTWAARRLVARLPDVTVLPARGFGTGEEEFAAWAGRRGQRRLLMEDFYRDARRRLDILMDGADPAAGRWNFDADNREPPPAGGLSLPAPPAFEEDEIDEQVRRDLDAWQRSGDVRLTGQDGPREFPVTRSEALESLRSFVRDRLPVFGPQQDAMLAGDPVMAHSMLSPALNLGLLDPVECAHAAEDAYRAGRAPLASVEGFIRQLIGWRDYVWNLYWHFGDNYRHRNALGAREPLPRWFAELDAESVTARCLSDALARVRGHGHAHHIIRLMVLGNYAIQRGWDPEQVTEWFRVNFVDGYDWVMVPNVVGMSQHADGGLMATKPYLGGGAYINRMSDYCGPCPYRPAVRLGPDACPFTAGYWSFLDRHADRFAANPRMARPVKGLNRLADLRQVTAQEKERGSDPP